MYKTISFHWKVMEKQLKILLEVQLHPFTGQTYFSFNFTREKLAESITPYSLYLILICYSRANLPFTRFSTIIL